MVNLLGNRLSLGAFLSPSGVLIGRTEALRWYTGAELGLSQMIHKPYEIFSLGAAIFHVVSDWHERLRSSENS